jgi:hypothetical protein
MHQVSRQVYDFLRIPSHEESRGEGNGSQRIGSFFSFSAFHSLTIQCLSFLLILKTRPIEQRSWKEILGKIEHIFYHSFDFLVCLVKRLPSCLYTLTLFDHPFVIRMSCELRD